MPRTYPHVHVLQNGDGFEVWLDTESGERDGICLSTGAVFEEAVRQGINNLATARYALERMTEEIVIKVE